MGGGFLRSVADVGKGYPEWIFPVPSPKAPAVVFLDYFRKPETGIYKRREMFFQPGRKILSKATGVNEVRHHLPMFKEVSFNCDAFIHSGIRSGRRRRRFLTDEGRIRRVFRRRGAGWEKL